MEKRLGFIGLGAMGSSMVRRLCGCGFQVTVYDQDPEKSKPLAELCAVAGDIAALTKEHKVIMTNLPKPADVEDAYLGPDGILANASSGTICIDSSIIAPGTIKRIYAAGKENGVFVLDSPVNGEPENALDGSLVVMIGGDKSIIPQVEDIFKALGNIVHYAGESGCGDVARLINTAIAQSNMALTCETFTMGVKYGVDPGRLFDVLSTTGARSYNFVKRWPTHVLIGDWTAEYKLIDARDEIRLALDMAKELDAPLPIMSNIHEVFTAGVAKGWGEEDCAAIVKYYEELGGVENRR